MIGPMWAVAGSLASKKYVPPLSFVWNLPDAWRVGSSAYSWLILIVGGLTYSPRPRTRPGLPPDIVDERRKLEESETMATAFPNPSDSKSA